MVFPMIMYGCESWTIRKAEHQRMDAFELWCWRRLLKVPWTARRFSQPILKEITPGCSLEGLMSKPELQYFGHLMQRTDSFEKTEEPEFKLTTSAGSLKKQESSGKTSTSALLTMPKLLTVWIATNCGKFKRWVYQTTLPASQEICMQVRKQQLELDMEQQTGSK